MKKTSLLLISFLWSLQMLGQISVELLSYANMPDCDGVIEVFAQGTAGPFTVEVVQYEEVVKLKTPIPNGENSLLIEGLCDGKHHINVTNNFGCVTQLVLFVTRCEFMIKDDEPSKGFPSTCGAEDGYIRFFNFPLVGGIGNLTYTWTNQEGAIIPHFPNNGLYIRNLGSSIYTLSVEDENGCIATADYDLLSENEPDALGAATASCEGEDNGRVSLVATMPPANNPGRVNFEWSNGVVIENSVVGTIENLSPGTYTVTISDLQGLCAIERSYIIEERASTGPFNFTSSVGLSCGSDNDGFINLAATGGNPPYRYRWNESGIFSASRSGLAGGDYCVTITDDCDREIRQCFDIALPEPEIEIVPIIACNGEGALTANLIGGIGPFKYFWSNGEDSQTFIEERSHTTEEGLERGEHCVRIVDGNRCSYNACYDLQLPGITITESAPCEGLNDGSVAVEVFNPFSEDIELFFDDVIELTVESGITSVFNIDDLYGEVEYSISGYIGSCEISESFTLGEKPVNYRFSEYRKNSDVCVYDTYCEDDLLVEGGLIEGSRLSYGEGYGGGLFFGCHVPRYCGFENVDNDKKYSRKKIKVQEYLMMMDYLETRPGLHPFPGGYIREQADFVRNKYPVNKRCKKMKYCTASLKWAGGVITSIGAASFNIEPFPGTAGDCWRLTCSGISSNSTFCISEISPDYIGDNLPSPPPVEFDCEYRRHKIQQLIIWYDDLLEIPEFNVPLDEPLFSLKEFLDEVIADPEKLQKAPCAEVGFCKTDFSYIWDDLDLVDCETENVFDLNRYCELQDVPNSGFWKVNCKNKEKPIYYNPVDFSFDIDILSIPNPPNENGSVIKVLGNNDVNSYFVNLGVVKDEENASSLGFFNSDLGSVVNEFSAYSINQIKRESPFVTQYLDDIEDDITIYVEKISESKSILWFENEYSSWSQTIETPSMLEISHLSKKNHSIYVGGTFEKYLGYEEQKVFYDKKFSGFLLEINYEGELLNRQIVENINPTTDFLIEDGPQGILLSGEPQETAINVNGQYHEIQDGGIFNIKISSESVTTDTEIKTQGNIKTKKVIQALEDGKKTYLFKGAGGIEVDGISYETIDQDIVVIKVNYNGTRRWFKRFRSINGGEIKSIDMVSGENESVYVGLTFTGGLAFIRDKFYSKGREDILILKLDKNGDLIEYKQYGTKEDERVIKLFYDTGVLYFGGEFAGENKEREIGKFRFFNFSKATNNAYVSYLFDSDFEKGATKRSENSNLTNELNKAMIAMPNPFSEQITIEANDPLITQLAIYNTLGEQVAISKMTDIRRWKVDFSGIPKGLYILQATNEKGQTIAVESIVHQ